jgi:hypothetical protein
MAEALSDHYGQMDLIGVPNFLPAYVAVKSAPTDIARSNASSNLTVQMPQATWPSG